MIPYVLVASSFRRWRRSFRRSLGNSLGWFRSFRCRFRSFRQGWRFIASKCGSFRSFRHC